MIFARAHLNDPALEAARFLHRLAFIILMIVAPIGEVASHGLLYVLFPVGVAVFVIAGLLAGGEQALRRIIVAFLSTIGMGVAFLAFWSGLSLIWTLFPGEAVARLARTLLTAGMALLAIVSLPERTKISNIYLLPMGVAITAAATLLMIFFGPDSFREGPNPDYILAQRCVMSLAILLWPALGALALRDHFIIAAGLAIIVAAATLASFLPIALAAMMGAALTYVAAMTNPLRVARIMAAVFAIVLLGAPLFVAFLYPIVAVANLSFGGAFGVFSSLVVHEWPRFITGHGLDMVERAMDLGLLPPDTPQSIVFVLWYELGVVGVAGFVFLLTAILLATARLALHVAPAFLAVLAAFLIIAFFGAETTQLWWMTLNGVAAIAIALLIKAHPRSKRPPAPAAHQETEAEAEEMGEPYPEPDF
jgi:hypothetical protein